MESAQPEKYKISKIIDAISFTMTCKECPYPCTAKESSSTANCQYHWYQILSWTDAGTPWVKGVQDELFALFVDRQKPVKNETLNNRRNKKT